MFTGRAPIAQPPGSDTSAEPYRATSGPSTRIDGTHGLDQLVWRERRAHASRGSTSMRSALVDGDARAQSAQQLDHRRDVVQVRHVADRHRAVGEQRAGQDRQGRVLGAGDAHLAVERHAAADLQFVHARRPSARVPGRRQVLTTPPACTPRSTARGSHGPCAHRASRRPADAAAARAGPRTAPRRRPPRNGCRRRWRRGPARRAGRPRSAA